MHWKSAVLPITSAVAVNIVSAANIGQGNVMWISDDRPDDAASRSLEIANGKVSGTTQVASEEVSVQASCPG